MNVFIQFKKIALCIALVACQFLTAYQVRGQSSGVEFVSLEMLIGDTLQYQFFSAPPYLPKFEQYGVFPKHGLADLPGSGPLGVTGWNTLTYIPNTNIPVRDTILIQYWKFENNLYFSVNKTIEVLVVPSFVYAVADYAETQQNQSVTIPVLNNDFTNGNSLQIADVPLVNNGTVELTPDQTEVIFTPAPDFSGLSHFNYSICDDLGTCAVATVTVLVRPDFVPTLDTLFLTATKNTPREVLLSLDGFDLAQAPSNGSLDTSSQGYLLYIPNPGFANGIDVFSFEKDDNGELYTRVVVVDVLDAVTPNTFVVDDYAYTTMNQSVIINVRQNDLGGPNLQGIAVIMQPSHGSVISLGQGMFEYIPNGTFSGVDVWRYRAFSPNYAVMETGFVYVTVSDFTPLQASFNLSTPKNTPLVIAYSIPVYDYNFSIQVAPQHGQAEFFPGFQEVEVNGQTFQGYNMLLYTPNPNTAGITDDFEIEYCVSAGDCPTAQIKIYVDLLDIEVPAEHFCLGNNCVWPGDVNADGIVDMRDLLPLGLAIGEIGPSRENPTMSEWYGQFGQDWPTIYYPQTLPLKHMDTDGNGIIGASDTLAINQFYLNKHSIVPAPVANLSPVPLYFYQTNVEPVALGDLVTLEIHLGDPNAQIAKDVYGFNFSLGYDPELVDPSSVKINFRPDSWISYNSPVLHLTKKPFNGRIDAGVTRTNGYSDNGYGIIAVMEFVVIEDIEGVRLNEPFIDLNLYSGNYMNGIGNNFQLPGSNIRIPLRLEKETETETLVIPASLKVQPNPTSNHVYLHLNGGMEKEIEQLTVFNLSGQVVHHVGRVHQKGLTMETASWTPGMYILRVLTNDGSVVTEKLEVIR
jgi:hypothetical protein